MTDLQSAEEFWGEILDVIHPSNKRPLRGPVELVRARDRAVALACAEMLAEREVEFDPFGGPEQFEYAVTAFADALGKGETP